MSALRMALVRVPRHAWRDRAAGWLVGLACRIDHGLATRLYLPAGGDDVAPEAIERCLLEGALHAARMIRAEREAALAEIALRTYTPQLFTEAP